MIIFSALGPEMRDCAKWVATGSGTWLRIEVTSVLVDSVAQSSKGDNTMNPDQIAQCTWPMACEKCQNEDSRGQRPQPDECLLQ